MFGSQAPVSPIFSEILKSHLELDVPYIPVLAKDSTNLPSVLLRTPPIYLCLEQIILTDNYPFKP